MKKNKNAMPAGRQGFTLFELLVSISIIGIMMALAIVSYSAAQKKARDGRRIQDISTIGKAAEQFYSQAGTYVYPGNDLIASWSTGGVSILNMFPVDPKNVAPNVYTYGVNLSRTSFCVCAKLETVNTGNSSTIATIGSGVCDYTTAGSKDYFCTSNQQ